MKKHEKTVRLNRSAAVTTTFEWLGSLLKMLVVFVLASAFCFRVAKVDGYSMETTLIDTDRVLVTDLYYTPHQGDIVIISRGEQHPEPLVKRIIATAGQRIEIDFDRSIVYVDGEKLSESYIQGTTVRGTKPDEQVNGVIPEGKVFVMGDNREHSGDSRFTGIGLIDESWIIGKVQMDIIPHTYRDGEPVVDWSRIRYLYD